MMTVNEVAELVGTSPQAIYHQRHIHKGASMQMIVEMYRRGEIGLRKRPAVLHNIHGEWMTVEQAAKRLGFHPETLVRWRLEHPRPDGTPGLLEDAWDYYSDARAGLIVLNPRRTGQARRYWIHGKRLTIAEASERYGLDESSLRKHVARNHCSVQTACDSMIETKKQRAAAKIMRILTEGGQIDG